MSQYLVNKTINDLQFSGLKVYYNFDSYSGDYINSIESGESLYSGEIKNYQNDFTGSSSGSGFFNGQYIEIKNSENITSESATIIFSQKKTGSSNGVIFSHLDPSGPSGWEIGINEANKYYFKHFVDGNPYYNFIDCYMADQNMCAVSIGENGSCKLHRLDFSKYPKESIFDQFLTDEEKKMKPQYYETDSEEYFMPKHTVSNGAIWKIGSGEFLYKGYLDRFLYFDEQLADESIRAFMNAIYTEVEYIEPISGQVSGEITGYSKIETLVTGTISSGVSSTDSSYNSGYYTYSSGIEKTGFADISGAIYIPYTGIDSISGTDQIGQILYRKVVNLSYSFGLTGESEASAVDNFRSSGSYWNISGNSGTYKGHSAIGPTDTIFGITGFEVVEVTGYKTGIGATGYQRSRITGALYSTYSYQPEYSPEVDYLISEGYFSGDRSEPDPLYFSNEISLLAQAENEYFYEIIFDIYNSNDINYTSGPQPNADYKKGTAYIEKHTSLPTLQVSVNGVSQMTGNITYAKDQFNLPTFSVSTGFYMKSAEIFTLDDLDNDNIIYDITYSGEKQALTISSLGDYSSAPFIGFDFLDKQVFFNGIKLCSGLDYIDNGGFYPIGSVTGSTGIYFNYPKYKDGISFTGSGDQPITIQHEGIMPKGYVVFANGVRQESKNIIEHAKESDLISGTKTLNIGKVFYTCTNGKIIDES
jgi:hypothetical protein